MHLAIKFKDVDIVICNIIILKTEHQV